MALSGRATELLTRDLTAQSPANHSELPKRKAKGRLKEGSMSSPRERESSSHNATAQSMHGSSERGGSKQRALGFRRFSVPPREIVFGLHVLAFNVCPDTWDPGRLTSMYVCEYPKQWSRPNPGTAVATSEPQPGNASFRYAPCMLLAGACCHRTLQAAPRRVDRSITILFCTGSTSPGGPTKTLCSDRPWQAGGASNGCRPLAWLHQGKAPCRSAKPAPSPSPKDSRAKREPRHRTSNASYLPPTHFILHLLHGPYRPRLANLSRRRFRRGQTGRVLRMG